MKHFAIPQPSSAHAADLPTDPTYWDREMDARLDGDVLARHGRRCSCCSSVVTR